MIAGEQDIEISLALSRITADFSFSHANSAQGTITGTGEPGATIEVTRAGSLIASAEVSWNGNFSVRTPAPNKGGVDKIDVLQRSQGTVGPNTVQLTPDYGEPVSITSPADGTVTSDGTILLEGRGVPGGDLTLSNTTGGGEVASTVVSASGSWSVDVADLPSGAVEVEASVRGRGDNVTSAKVTIHREDAPVEALEVLTPAEGETVPSGTVTFTGTANAGAKVQLVSNQAGAILGEGTADATGNWTADVNRELGVGDYKIIVRNGSTDVIRSFTVKKPVVETLKLTAPAENSVVAPGTVTFTGTANAGAKVQLVSNQSGAILGEGTADATGNWTADVNRELGVGDYKIIVRNGSTDVIRSFTVKKPVVETLKVTAPAENSVVAPGTVTFTGTANAGAKVQLVSNQAGAILGEGTADATGNWTADVNRELGVGDYKIIVRNGSTDVIRSFTVKKPVVETLKVTAPAENSVVAPGTVTFTGTANAGAKVQLVSNQAGAILGEGTADATGNWTADVNRELGVGDYKIIVRNGSTDVIRSFTVKKPVVETLKVTAPAENSVVAPGTVTFTGTANAGAKVQLVSNQSGNELGSAVAAADGTWSADVNRDLQAGTYIIVVKNGALQLDRAFTVK
ncbi:Ig-like domain-containing protein [Leucobacter aridicollis]|uniref:Bacterial Ig domain-containing protein n=2 Tax=Leucobacter aridicollis TaxID=283878 RepID=A0A852R417_9MICO|nr:Ig-like domain-containing protein [Leucobacter aridicollis]NYD25219.1 hypothetical protein [Leucobacter aridicollis]